MKRNLAETSAVISKALLLCEPTPAEQRKISAVADKCRRLVEKEVSRNDRVTGVVFGGSYAKGTWLRGDADIDVFVKVVPSVGLQEFEEMGKGIGLASLKEYDPMLRYSDHPYVEAIVDGTRVNVVPCYDVEQGKWQSAADRSPFHTEYILRNFDHARRRETRLLKTFLKSAGIYGAEISTGGFSGYVSEVLVMKFGTFEQVLAAASDLAPRQVISVDPQYDPDVVKGFTSPLIIIDPVDPRRNLGTAISPENVGNFVMASRSFLAKPSLDFFGKVRRRTLSTKSLARNILVIEFKHPQRSPDVIWGQLKRTLGSVRRQLELAGFTVFRSVCVTDERDSAAMAFLLESLTLPKVTTRKGPDIYRRADTASFLAGLSKRPYALWVESDMRLTVLSDRKATDAVDYAKSLFGKRMANSGISKDLLARRSMLRIYTGAPRKTSGPAREAVDEVVSTEHFISMRA